MRFLIGLFLFHVGSYFLFAWENKTPEFHPAWIGSQTNTQITQYKKYLKKDLNNTSILTRIGYLYILRGHYKQARRYLNLASLKKANDSFFFLSKGLLHSYLNEDSLGEKFLFKALLVNQQEDPQYFFHFADHLFRTGKISKSIHWLQLGLKLHPSQPHLLTLLARNHISQSNWEQAEPTLIKARQVHSEFDRYLSFNLAKMYAILQDWDSAIYNLRRATLNGYKNFHTIKLEPSFEPIREHPQFLLLLDQAERNSEKFLNLYRFKKI